MPEGPEIRRAADRVERAISGRRVIDIAFAHDHLKPFEHRLTGHVVQRIETRGKAMLIHFDTDLSIYSHNQLYGRWYVTRPGRFPQTNRQLRLAIHNDRASALLYSASEIAVLTPAQIASHSFLSGLGPDVLTANAGQLMRQLRSRAFSRRRLASLFLDQHFLAGIGNYLRSEILFVAGLHPQCRPVDCSQPQLEALAQAALAVAGQAYRHDGVTNDLADVRRLKAEGQRRGAYRHWVFGRAGLPCRRCDTAISKGVAASRRIYCCPSCQPAVGGTTP